MTPARPAARAPRRPAVTWSAWALCGLSLTLALASIVLATINGESPAELVTNHHAIGILDALTLPIVGALVVLRDPRHLLGWLLVVISVVFLTLLFPDGRLPSRRWWPLAWAGAVIAVVPTAILAVGYWPLRGPELVTGTGSLPPLVDSMFAIAFSGALLLGAGSVVSLVLRFRRSGAVQRQQIKWFAYGAIVSVPLGAFPEVPGYGPYLELLGTVLLLAGLGIGIFRYRLWEIDRLVNRTLVYGLLTAILGGCYALGVLVIGQALSPGAHPSSLVVAASTLAVAAVFGPLRRGIQRAVDRRFNRRHYDAAKTIDAFAARLRQHVDLQAMTEELLAVADQTMQPTTVT